MKKKAINRKHRSRTARNEAETAGKVSGGHSPALRINRRDLLVGAGLIVAVVAVYGQVISHHFINLDDDIYIYENPMVTAGLTIKGLRWAFTTFHAANWHPLTWLSHMFDAQVFGLSPGADLAVNVFLHTLNSLLVFTFLKNMTGRLWRSAIVAGLFALHPMHVESVAWAAERKDVLSAFFALLSLLAYIRYAKADHPSWKQFLPVTVSLALALMAKPMFVTWPFVMLLLDYWPLNRLEWRPDNGPGLLAQRLAPLIREKIPVFVLAAASVAITYIAQSRGGAVRQFADAPILLRVSNALVSYAKYIVSLLWPGGLGVYYPFSPEGIPPWELAASLALVACITVFVMRAKKNQGYLLTGWAWYLGTLVPVIGIIQVGGQTMADRYSYIPSIGLFVMIVWVVGDLIKQRPVLYRAAAFAVVVWLAILGSLACVQVGFWRDSITLFRHTLLVAPGNLVAHYNLAHALGKQGNLDEAIVHFGEALRIKPDFFDALINIGVTLNDQRKFAEAATYLTRAVELQPQSSKAHLQLAISLAQNGRSDEALGHFFQAMELSPNDPDVRTNLGLMLARIGKFPEAREQLGVALRLNPNSPEAHNNLGLVLLMQGDADKSIPEFSTALRLKPEFKLAQENLNRAQAQSKARRE
ncbi:MAG TPA: tetratricopeptide repeat protein [Blastocatellia bacterium]|nr:tetratricopeptide repeat protein [Blastocatellia bacterium]